MRYSRRRPTRSYNNHSRLAVIREQFGTTTQGDSGQSITASVRKGLEMASLATSQNTGNTFSTWKLAIRRNKYKMSSK